jgi:hypothetical protein
MVIMGHRDMKKSFGPSALVSPRVLLGVGLVTATALFGGTGCGLSYSLTGLYVEPSTGLTCVVDGVSAQYHAYGTYTEGNHTARTEDITGQVTWSATIPAVASINSSGLATGVGDGTTAILASTQGEFGLLSNASSIQVDPAGCGTTTSIRKDFSLSIIPGNQNFASAGQSAQPLAIATYNGGERTADLSRQVTWVSNNARVATVDTAGVITATGPGDAVITAQTKAPDGEVVSATQTIHVEGTTQDQ